MSAAGRQPADPWAPTEIEATALLALWPGDAPPEMGAVLAAIGRRMDEQLRVIAEAAGEGEAWSALVEAPRRGWELALWTESAPDLEPGELDDATARCSWLVGVEGVLDPDAPLECFAALMQLLAGPEVPAVLDANTRRWHRWPARGDEHVEPEPAVLWITHVVTRADGEDAWIHTHGLARCGLPDLEMLEVDGRLVDAGIALLDAIAGRLIEETPPPPGAPFAAGPGLEVTLQPWQDVVDYVDEAPGGRGDRDEAHGGMRAVVCGREPQGAYRAIYRWPREALQRIDAGRAALFMSHHETEDRARRAQATWPRLAEAFAGLRPGRGARFLLKAGMAAGDRREHLWFLVRRFERDRAEAALVNQPAVVADLKPGDVAWIERDAVSDWSVETPAGSFGPAEASDLASALSAMSGEDSP